MRTRLSEAVETAAACGVTYSVPATPHAFHHSYAIHMLYAGIPLKVLQSLMEQDVALLQSERHSSAIPMVFIP